MTAEERKRTEVDNFKGTMREWYREVYLKSEHWHDLRWKKLNSMNRKCEKCGRVKRLDVHHLDYRNIYDVELTDLQVLCRRCHTLEHHPELRKPEKTKPQKKKKGKKKKNRRQRRAEIRDSKPQSRRRRKKQGPLKWRKPKSKSPHLAMIKSNEGSVNMCWKCARTNESTKADCISAFDVVDKCDVCGGSNSI